MQLFQLVKWATTREPLHNRNFKNKVIQMDRMSCLHNVPKRVLGRSTYLHTYRHETHGSYSDPDGGENYTAVRDNVHLTNAKWSNSFH